MAGKKKGTRKQTSDELSSLASDILAGRKKPTKSDVNRLAGSVLGQDETPGPRKKRAKKKT